MSALAAGAARSKSGPVGEVGALPGVPEAQQERSSKAPKKSIEKQRLLRRYDKAFTLMLTRHGNQSSSEALQRIKPIIYELSPEIRAWTGDARIRVYLLLQEIRKGLDDPSSVKASLDLLYLLLSKGGHSAVEMARPMFHDKIQELYGKSVNDNERFLPRLLLMLDDYDPKALENLTKDAIHVWGDDRFRAASGFLGLEELREKGLRPAIKGLLGEEIARAGTTFDRTALNRAVELYHEVK